MMTTATARVPMRPRGARLLASAVALASATGLLATLAAPAGAAPIDDKRKQAAALEAEIATAADNAAHLYEELKHVEDQLGVANATIADAQARIATAQAETDRLEGLVHQRAAAIYRSATKGTANSLFELDIRAMSSRERYASAASERDNSLLDQLDAARKELHARERDATEAREAAQSQKAQLEVLKNDFEAAQAERERLLASVQGEVKSLVDQAARQRAAAEAPKPRGGGDFDPGQIPPASGRGGIVIGFAQAQLGKPYVYGASGPDAYDCSGLTMAAWGAAGVGLPHNSESQYNSFPRVPMDQLAAGDVVWYPGHVGLYAGGGAVIHASSSGGMIRYQSVSYYRGAIRPG